MDVGFIGLGAMGRAMAANLVKAGHKIRAWNRSGKGPAALDMVGKPADVFQADAAFTMLSDAPAIREVLLEAGVLHAARVGVVHVVSSTISVAFAGELAAAHEKIGIGYVSAPVLGRPDVAKASSTSSSAASATRWRFWASGYGTWAKSPRAPTPQKSPRT